jgi:hypothetical protein
LVHAKVPPAGVEVKLEAGTLAPGQTVTFAGVFAVGFGFTVTVKLEGVPAQPPAVGVTVMVEVTPVEPVFAAVQLGILPVPLAPKPVLVVLLVHVNVPPGGTLAKLVAATVAPGQTVLFAGTVGADIVGVGFTVMVNVLGGPAQPFAVGVTVTVLVIGEPVLFTPAVNTGVLPLPLAPNPVPVLLFVHVTVPPGGVVDNVCEGTEAPGQAVTGAGTLAVGAGLTVTV